MPPTSSFFSTRFVGIEFLLAGALLFYEKIRRSDELFWFGLRDVGIFQIFYSRAVLQSTIVDSPAFLEPMQFSRKDCSLSPYNPSDEEVGGLDGFLYETA